ncbi:MAG: hypothetical protein ACR2OV_00270 [Hyphomicrobiaceae bacterium]
MARQFDIFWMAEDEATQIFGKPIGAGWYWQQIDEHIEPVGPFSSEDEAKTALHNWGLIG